jgi:CrcB protein
MRLAMLRYFWVGLAGFLGAVARLGVGQAVGRLNFRFPLGTLLINISGSLLLGWFLTYATPRNVSDTVRLAVAVGFVGAYTTFSTFMYESVDLADQKAWIAVTANLVGSIVLGLLAVRVGMVLGRWSGG